MLLYCHWPSGSIDSSPASIDGMVPWPCPDGITPPQDSSYWAYLSAERLRQWQMYRW
ncbi:MAG: hypothetical protein ACNS60_14200 [Candidatus Cyclobacteriaceae bacterium M2_1C_046]